MKKNDYLFEVKMGDTGQPETDGEHTIITMGDTGQTEIDEECTNINKTGQSDDDATVIKNYDPLSNIEPFHHQKGNVIQNSDAIEKHLNGYYSKQREYHTFVNAFDTEQKISKESIKRNAINNILNKYKLKYYDDNLYNYLNELGYYKLLESKHMEYMVDKATNSDVRFSTADIKETIRKIELILYKEEKEPFNPDDNLINFKDGVLNTESMEMLEHSEKFNFNYCLNAKINGKKKHKNFDAFLDTLTSSSDSKKMLLQEIIGYCLSNYFKAKCAFILLGVPNCGKSTLLEVIAKIIGKENVSNSSFSALNNRFELSAVYGKRINICGEIGTDEISDVSRFKSITGNDTVNIEFKGETPFPAKLNTKFLFAGNNVPVIKNEEYCDAVYNRFVLIYFSNSVPREKCDINMDKLLFKERDHIVKWAMEGLYRLRKNNWVFTVDEESEAQKQKLLGSSKSLEFFEKKYVRYDNAYDFTSSTDLFDAFADFCENEEYKPKSNKELISYFANKSNVRKTRKVINGKYLRGFKGITLLKQPENND